MPAIIRSAGPDGWGTIAVGQAVGVVASVVVMYGWSVVGPASVANASGEEADREYLTSLVVRIILFPPTLAAGVGFSWILTRGDLLLTAVAVSSTALLGLRAGWFFIGRGTPWRLLLYEAMPRALGVWVGVSMLLFLDADVWVAIAWQSIGLLMALGASSVRAAPSIVRSPSRALETVRRIPIRRTLGLHGHSVSAATISALFGSSPLMILSIVAPAGIPAFALVYRFQSQLMTAASPIMDFLQGWVPRGAPAGLVRRAWTAQAIAVCGAACAVILVATAGPRIYDFLGGGVIETPPPLIGASALSLALALVVQVSGIGTLPAFGGARELARNVTVGSLTGVATVFALAYQYGGVGALFGLSSGLAVTATLNLVALARLSKKWKER